MVTKDKIEDCLKITLLYILFSKCIYFFLSSFLAETVVLQLNCHLLFGDTFEDDPKVTSTIKTYLNTEALITNDIIAFAPWVRNIYHA